MINHTCANSLVIPVFNNIIHILYNTNPQHVTCAYSINLFYFILFITRVPMAGPEKEETGYTDSLVSPPPPHTEKENGKRHLLNTRFKSDDGHSRRIPPSDPSSRTRSCPSSTCIWPVSSISSMPTPPSYPTLYYHCP